MIDKVRDYPTLSAPSTIPVLKPLRASVRYALIGVTIAGMSWDVLSGELPIPKAAFVTAGRADYAIAGNTLKINQQTDRSILNWQSFNVGKDNTVRFVQPSSSAIALNRIDQADPSKIMGKVSANGQIYLINRNGFVFGKDSKVDANSMMASTLDITDETFSRGVTKVVDQDGRAGLIGNGDVYRKDADGKVVLDANGKPVKARIDIEAGASITSGENGRLIFAAAAIDNAGNISAPEGQIIMAGAGDKVYLQEAGTDSKLRGLLVEVGSGGEVVQRGKLMAAHGNVTLVGFAVNQSGRVSASTSVRSAGSVKLLAREGGQARREGEAWVLEATRTTRSTDAGDGLSTSARLVLGQGSVTEATPDLNDPTKTVDGQTQDQSWMMLMGQKVVLQQNATLRSRSGDVTLVATENPVKVGLPAASSKNQSRIYIDEGATIDVSGVKDIAVPMERNVVEVELRSNELRDSPLQRNGVLYAKTVNIDIRKGTPLADITGAIERIERTVAERSATGGSLKLISEGDALIRPHSLLDFSGGSLAYQSGFISTTQLVSQGKIYDIGEADPNRIYDGIVGNLQKFFPRWGVTEHYETTGATAMGRYEQGYVEGKNAGHLSIQTNNLLLDGDLQGAAINGALQRDPASRAQGGDLTLDLVSGRAPDSTITQPVVFVTDRKSLVLGENDLFPMQPDSPNEAMPLTLPVDLYRRTGILSANIKTSGQVQLKSGDVITVEPTGSLALQGGKVQIEGVIKAASGAVKLTTHIPTTLTVGDTNPFDGSITLGRQGAILTQGIWNNERPGKNDTPDMGPVFIQGGQVNITAQGNIDLSAGSRIDVSGGGQHRADRRIVAGNAGSITLLAANDIGGKGSTLKVDGEMSGYALKGGRSGTLRLASSEILIDERGNPVRPGGGTDPQPLILNPEFFRRGGFGRYSIESNKQGVTIDEGTRIDISVANRLLDGTGTQWPTGTDLSQFSHIGYLPEAQRPAGELDLVLAQKVGQGDAHAAVTLAAGASIHTDAGGTVKLTSDTRIQVDGQIDTPAGTMALHVTTPFGTADQGFVDSQTLWLGAKASLSAVGKALVLSDEIGHLQGNVLPGGRIDLLADRGFVVLESGSLLDVSGTQADLDLPARTQLGAVEQVRTQVPSDGGAINFRAAEGIILDGRIMAAAGQGAGAAGGDLTIELDPRTRAEPPELAPGQTPFPRPDTYPSIIELTGATLPAAAFSVQAGESIPSDWFGRAELSDTALTHGGAAALTLRTPDRIQWQGDVSLSLPRSLELDAPNLAAAEGKGSARLVSSYVAMGSTETRIDDINLRPSVLKEATGGEGRLDLVAKQLDIYGLSVLTGIGQTHLASEGDIRLIGVRSSQLQREYQGSFTTAGNLELQASQIYPTTLSDFRLAVTHNPDGILSIQPGTRESTDILSAGGKLTVEAANILQAGTLKVPEGELTLTATDTLWLAPGSVTSNSLQTAVVPFGRTQGGLDWIYPLVGQNLVYAPQPQTDTLPPPVKSMSLTAKSVQLDLGSRVDTSGGGDLYAFEFIPGPGGSVDVLDRYDPKYVDGTFSYHQNYAVIPGFASAYAPYDPIELPASGLNVGEQVYLSAGGGLKAGTYTLLPAHYALLPGAYLVTVEPNTQDVLPGQNLKALSGDPIVAGYRKTADTDFRDIRWSGFSIEPRSVVRSRAEYTDSYANTFFVDRAGQLGKTVPLLPRDAGSIRLSAENALALRGAMDARPGVDGKGGSLDIEAANLAIIAASSSDSQALGSVNILADDLNRLGVASIAIGGIREQADGYTHLITRASHLTIGQDAKLYGAEFILTAKDSITLQSGAEIQAKNSDGKTLTTDAGDAGTVDPAADGSGSASTQATSQNQAEASHYRLTGDSAFLEISSGTQANFDRVDVSGTSGSIQIDAGATLSADGAVIADSTLDTQLKGSILMDGGSIALGASRIGLGVATGNPGGLLLSSAALQSLKVDNLTLNSRSSLDLYDGVDLNLQGLVVRSAAILGFDQTGAAASIHADTIRLENTDAAVSNRVGTGTGQLTFTARQIELGQGDFRFQGFASTDFKASEQVYGLGEGRFGFASDVNLTTPVLAAGQSANTTLDASGYAFNIGHVVAGAETQAALSNLGARLSVVADHITNAARINLPSGVIRLNALAGDLILDEGTQLSVAGQETRFGDTAVFTDGGDIDLAATGGNVELRQNASLDLTGNQGGLLQVTVPQGSFVFDGKVAASGKEAQGSFALDVQSLQSGASLGAIASRLADSGFGDALDIRVRAGNLSLAAGESLAAHTLNLTADSGNITLAGTVTVQGQGAQLSLSAGDDLTLTRSARLAAEGTPGQVGKVLLEAVDGDRDGKGQLSIESGAAVDVTAQDGSEQGQVRIRVSRNDAGDLAFTGNVQQFAGKATDVTLEAVRSYDRTGTIAASDIAAWKSDTDDFMAKVDTLEATINLPGGLRPGVEIRSSGDLALGSDGWDLLDWRYGGRPGVLSLTAQGNLSLNGHLSDGFKTYDDKGIDLSDLAGPGAVLPVKDMLQTGDSWSYRLNSGADIVIANTTMVRTGTGDISINAGHDFILGDSGSVVYTAGKPTDEARYGTYKNAFMAYTFYGEYPVNGGDVSISAGRDIKGAVTGQFFDGWLSRTGDWSRNLTHSGETPTSWAVALGRPDIMGDGTGLSQGIFAQNVGALGGGNVTVRAGGDIRDFSVMLPTTGKQLGEQAHPEIPDNTDYNTTVITESSGGNLVVDAGGDVTGGTYYVAKGTGDISAAGSIKGSAAMGGMGPILATGDSQYRLNAGGQIVLGGALNPTVIQSSQNTNFFFTYSDKSGIQLTALSGNIELQNDFNTLLGSINALRSPDNLLTFNATTQSALQVYPASVQAAALQGNISLDASFVTYPSASGRMEMLADGSILTGQYGSNVNVTQSDADPGLLPTPQFPTAQNFDDAAQRLDPFGRADLTHAKVPLHKGNSDYALLYARTGGIAPIDPLLFTLSQPVTVSAGGDIKDTSFNIQHSDYAISTIDLGGDFIFTSPRNAQGNLINLTRQVQLSGAGQLWVNAGGNIDLGASKGILTLGNTFNSALADEGASVTVISGLKSPMDFAGFAKTYDPTAESHRAVLTDYFRKRTANDSLDDAAAQTAYQALSDKERREVLIQVFFDELKKSATKAALSGIKSDYDEGFAAINTLFPDQDSARNTGKYQGDLKLFFSTIKTVDGGDINILTPGGYVNAGLAASFAGSKSASELGLVVQGKGNLNAFVDGNFAVNQSRVFAMGGGGIAIWSSNGDIDAGRGAKAALAVPPPIVSFDEQGNLQIIYPPAVSGSGIRTASSNPAIPPGNVILAAPRGIVDAGEAGIGGNNIVIAANAVIGASNIDVGGSSSGVPTTTVSVPVGAAGAAAAAASAAQTAQQSVASSNEKATTSQSTAKAPTLNPLDVEVVGFGDCSVSDVKEGKAGCG